VSDTFTTRLSLKDVSQIDIANALAHVRLPAQKLLWLRDTALLSGSIWYSLEYACLLYRLLLGCI